nr:hunchback [Phoronopsis harmeri]
MMSVESMQHSIETPLEHMQTFHNKVDTYYIPPTNTSNMLLTENSAEACMESPSETQPAAVTEIQEEKPLENASPEVAINEIKTEDIPDIPIKMEKPADYDDMMPSPDLSESINSEPVNSPSSMIMTSPAAADMSHSSSPDQMRGMEPGKGLDQQPMNSEWSEDASTTVDADGRETYYCHLCSYSGNSKFHFNSHMNSHFEHHCQHCDYTSRTEGRLKRHIKDFHSQVPPPNYSGQARVVRNGSVSRPKIYRCKQCEFISQTKEEFWEHARSHIKDDKILQCPKCPFVTEYKHHLEYHLRNHFGSKPFKCPKCNYSCVNKSMLNSHMKSHTNVYQFRCADCTYATKYCHSLKLHLRKYNHKPASVLNLDGTVDESYDATSLLSPKRGPPRGPRGPRKDKMDISPQSGMMTLPPPLGAVRPPAMIPSPYWPVQNGVHIPPPPLIPTSGLSALQAQLFHGGNQPNVFRCTICGFKSEYKDELSRHMLSVHARENQDLFSMFGINSEALMEEHLKKMPPSEQQQHMIERQNSLHVRTEYDNQVRSGPTSWPMVHNAEPKVNKPHPSQSLPELYAEKNLVIDLDDKKPTKESPLDLTKPKSFEYGAPAFYEQDSRQVGRDQIEESEEDSQNPWSNSSQQQRKNKRKGRAFKLDALCLKLQEKCDNTGELIEDDGNGEVGESESPILSTSTPIMMKSDSKESQKDENHNGTIDYREIHENLSRLNSEADVFPHKKYRHSGVNEAEERAKMAAAFNEHQRAVYMQHHNAGLPMLPVTSSQVQAFVRRQQSINGIAVTSKMAEGGQRGKTKESYECHHCDIAFRDCIMYTMHMGYHGYQNPFRCNMCGHESKDKVAFFLHIARVAHA